MERELGFVEAFRHRMGLSVPDKPIPLSLRASLDRHHLMNEELSEYLQATAHDDPVEILDALVDLQYLLLGTVVEHGFTTIFPEAFRRVHIKNMEKIPGVNSRRKLLSSDVVKPREWTPANLEDLLDEKD